MGLEERKIALGISGSIAAYKAPQILRGLIKEGAEVYVLMTHAATRFVSPITFQALSKRPVITSLFHRMRPWEEYLDLAKRCELLLIAPATANIIGKMANGIGDDALTTFALSFTSTILIAPAMNQSMFRNPIVMENLTRLKGLGFKIIEPEYGELASREIGFGRLASVERIISEVKSLLTDQKLRDKQILITAATTHEPIDNVRYIGNRSTGKMGFSLAKVAKEMGARVTLVSGPTLLHPPSGVEFLQVNTTLDMYRVVKERFNEMDIGIFAGAPCDFRPSKVYDGKIKGYEGLKIEFIKNPDILKEIGEIKDSKILVGFSAEFEDILGNALRKLQEKNLDMIVANDISREDAGFGVDTNVVTIIDKYGGIETLPRLSKDEVARKILEKVAEMVEAAGFEPATSSVRRMHSPTEPRPQHKDIIP